MKNGVAEGVASEVNDSVDATSEIISTHLEQRCYSLPVVTILETFFSPVLHVHTFYLLLGEKTCTKKKGETYTHDKGAHGKRRKKSWQDRRQKSCA